MSFGFVKAQYKTIPSSKSIWVDSVFNSMTDDERLGQLFMVAAYSNRDEKHYQKIDSLVEVYKIGGLIFFQGGPKRQVLLTNRYQNKAKTKLLIGFDGEWGLNMRLDSTMSFPRQMTLGATFDEKLAYKMGVLIAQDCKRVGIHINFAPAVDINVNPNNPVIGMRSFGENKEQVTKMGIAYMKGLQHNGVMACGKHFPGHGDTDADSHYSMPVINHSKKRLEEVELYPFKKLIKDSLQSVMVAHIHVPSLDSRENIPTTLSFNTVTKLLKSDLGFKGLVFTDALNMKGVSKYYKPGEVDVLALLAGNDVLLFAEDVPTAILKINEAFDKGLLNKNEIFERVKKILSVKYDYGLNNFSHIDTSHIYQDLNTLYSKAENQKMYERAITLLKNDNNFLPIKSIESHSFAHVAIGKDLYKKISTRLSNYAPFTFFSILKKDVSEQVYAKYLDSLAGFSTVVITIHELNNRKKENYGLHPNAIDFIKKLNEKTNVVMVFGGNVYAVSELSFCRNLILSFEDNVNTQNVVPQLIFGAIPFQGELPVTVSPSFKYKFGIKTKPLSRLKYAFPESENIDSRKMYKIDSLISAAVEFGATPGIQMAISYRGSVVYNNSFGFLTYDKKETVKSNTIYDLASVSKTAGTLQAAMFLNSWKMFYPDSLLSFYIPEIKKSNKSNVIIRDMLAHQAGLVAYGDFWKKAIKANITSMENGGKTQNRLRVSQKWYSLPSVSDSVNKWMDFTLLAAEKTDTGCYLYKYSDLGFMYLKRIVDKQLNQPMDLFLNQNFYRPLGMQYLSYNPLNKFPFSQIAPTEEDRLFRKETIRATVHDQNAAILGGVAGHAGLFGTANDLLILGQMMLQKGQYGGNRYIKEQVVEEFTRQQYTNNRRALGWDRPFPPEEVSLASPKAYGHTGFTGTAWWIDPSYDLVVVILANRTFPFSENKTFTEYSFRTKILNAVYEVVNPLKKP